MKDIFCFKRKRNVIFTSFFFSFLLLVLVVFTCSNCQAADEAALRFNHVSLSEDSFNPKSGERISIFYHLSVPALISVRVYDRYGNLVRTVEEKYQAHKGSNKLSWDGLDDQGNIVPDEAYSFIIEAEGEKSQRAVYDATREYGRKIEVAHQRMDLAEGKFTYDLPLASRVLLRLGSPGNGPFYKTLVNWEPRCGGIHEEHWDGWDETHTIYLLGREGKGIIASYQAYALSPNVIITRGNPANPYDLQKQALEKQALVRNTAAAQAESGKSLIGEKSLIDVNPISPEERRSSHADPQLLIPWDIGLMLTPLSSPARDNRARDDGDVSMGEQMQTQYRVGASDQEFVTRVTIPDKDKPFLAQEQFELVFFIDDRFIQEAEVGVSLPYDYRWNTSKFEAGSHTLTTNIIGLKDHVGTASVTIWIDKER